jgi:hypothetical protein
MRTTRLAYVAYPTSAGGRSLFVQIKLGISSDLLAFIDGERGDVSRSLFAGAGSRSGVEHRKAPSLRRAGVPWWPRRALPSMLA